MHAVPFSFAILLSLSIAASFGCATYPSQSEDPRGAKSLLPKEEEAAYKKELGAMIERWLREQEAAAEFARDTAEALLTLAREHFHDQFAGVERQYLQVFVEYLIDKEGIASGSKIAQLASTLAVQLGTEEPLAASDKNLAISIAQLLTWGPSHVGDYSEDPEWQYVLGQLFSFEKEFLAWEELRTHQLGLIAAATDPAERKRREDAFIPFLIANVPGIVLKASYEGLIKQLLDAPHRRTQNDDYGLLWNPVPLEDALKGYCDITFKALKDFIRSEEGACHRGEIYGHDTLASDKTRPYGACLALNAALRRVRERREQELATLDRLPIE